MKLSYNEIIACTRIAANAETVTAARREAKAQGVSQAETERKFQYIHKIRYERILAVGRGHRWTGDRLSLNLRINRGNRDEFVWKCENIMAKRLYGAIWYPANSHWHYEMAGDEYKVSYESHYDGHYKGAYSSYAKKVWDVTITFPQNFMKNYVRVEEYDGINCLVHQTRELSGGVRVIRASVIRSPRTDGEVKFIPTWIAVHGSKSYHADTLRQAVEGLRRKETRTAIPARLTPNTKVTRAMYRALTGACEAGTREFCARFGLEKKRSITVRELLDIMPAGTYGRNILVNALA